MKRPLETTKADDASHNPPKKPKPQTPIPSTTPTLKSLRMQTGFKLSQGFDFATQIPLDELEALQGNKVEEPNVPRLFKSDLIHPSMIWRSNAPENIEDYLDIARSLTDVPERLQDVRDIVDTQHECETIMLDIQTKARAVASDDDLLELEEHIRFELSPPEKKLEIMQDGLDDFETELSVDLEKMGLLGEGELKGKDKEEEEEEDEDEHGDAEEDKEEYGEDYNGAGEGDKEEDEDTGMRIADMERETEDEADEITIKRALRCLSIPVSTDGDRAQDLEGLLLGCSTDHFTASDESESPYDSVVYSLGSLGDGGSVEAMDREGEDDEEIIEECVAHTPCLFGL